MYEKSVLKYKEDDKYGIIDFSGKKITKPIYDEIDSVSYKEGELLVKQNDKFGVINIKGNVIVDIDYAKISVDGYYTDRNQYKYAGYIVSNKTDEGYRYGYISNSGKKIVETEYNELSRISDIEDDENVYLIAAKNGQYGVMKNGKDLISNEYQSIRFDSTNNILVIEKSKKYGVANLEGKVIVPVQYDQIDITGIYMYAQENEKLTVYDKNGNQKDIDTSTAVLNTDNDKYKIKIDNQNGTKYGVINEDGKEIINTKYNYIEYLFDDYFIASSENGKLGIIDDKESQKVELKYDSIQRIQETNMIQATITSTNITELYNNNMKKVFEMNNANIETIKDGYIKIYNDSETKYFDKDGNEVDNTILYPNNKLFSKIQNGKYGFVDKSGKVVVKYKYDRVTEFNQNGFAAVKKNGKWGAINEQGEEIVEPKYELTNQVEPNFIGKYYQVKFGFGEFYYTDAM